MSAESNIRKLKEKQAAYLQAKRDEAKYILRPETEERLSGKIETSKESVYDGAYEHSKTAHAPSDAQKNSDITKAEIEAKLTGELTSHSHAAPSVPMVILTKSSTVNQNVGGANGTEVYWSWDGQTIIDSVFTHSTSVNSEQITVGEDGWYEITFIGAAQTTGSSRTTLQGIHRINSGTTSRAGGLRNYTRGASYGNVTTGLIYTVQLSADDIIEVGTRVEDSDAAYTINTSGGEISDDCHQLVIKKIR